MVLALYYYYYYRSSCCVCLAVRVVLCFYSAQHLAKIFGVIWCTRLAGVSSSGLLRTFHQTRERTLPTVCKVSRRYRSVIGLWFTVLEDRLTLCFCGCWFYIPLHLRDWVILAGRLGDLRLSVLSGIASKCLQLVQLSVLCLELSSLPLFLFYRQHWQGFTPLHATA